jgi:hypothetical protein
VRNKLFLLTFPKPVTIRECAWASGCQKKRFCVRKRVFDIPGGDELWRSRKSRGSKNINFAASDKFLLTSPRPTQTSKRQGNVKNSFSNAEHVFFTSRGPRNPRNVSCPGNGKILFLTQKTCFCRLDAHEIFEQSPALGTTNTIYRTQKTSLPTKPLKRHPPWEWQKKSLTQKNMCLPHRCPRTQCCYYNCCY